MALSATRALVVLACLVTVAHAWNPFEARSDRKLATCDPLAFPELTPFYTRSPVMDLEWVGADDQTVFALTHKDSFVADSGGLWRSTDGGSSFEELTGKLKSTAATNESFSVLGVFSQTSNNNNLLILSTGNYMWVSDDKGATLTAVRTTWRGIGIRSIKLHPWHDNWLLVLVKRPDCKSPDRALMECPHDLMLNTDMYSKSPKWVNLTEASKGKVFGFVDFDWGANLCPKKNCPDLPEINDQLILATMYATADAYNEPWDPDVSYVASTDWFASIRQQVRCGNMFEVIGRSVYLAVANSCPVNPDGSKRGTSQFPRGITLYTSLDGGQTFTQACLPVALWQEGYELVETHDGAGAVIIVDFVVRTGFMDLPASSVYTAGPHHALFSLSMTSVARSDLSSSTDFARIEGVPGIYIANMMVPPPAPSAAGAAAAYYDDYDLSDLLGKPVIETRITFNGGGRWQKIPAPTVVPLPACDRCYGNAKCYLHLHGLSSWNSMGPALPAVYSNPSAPGLIMGTGNVGVDGVGLDGNDGLCTWMSKDGGVSWSPVAEGAYIYEFADWGGIVVMARHPGGSTAAQNAKATDEVRFSLDYGNCWQIVKLQSALFVDNIRIEPDGQRPRVLVHGRACRNTTHPKCTLGPADASGATPSSSAAASEMNGIMYAVDIEALMKKANTPLGKCSRPTDYERWNVPSVTGTPRCVLGETKSIERRRDSAVCLNGPDFKREPKDGDKCPCAIEDTECDYGYIRDKSGNCTLIPSDKMPQCPVIQSNTYTVSSSGKRLVHGDVCTNPEAIIPDTGGKGRSVNPPHSGGGGGGGGGGGSRTHRSGWFGFLMFVLVAAVLCGAFWSWWRYIATEAHKDTLRDLAHSVKVECASLWGLLMDKIRRRPSPGGSSEELGYFQPLGDPGHDVEGRGGVFTLK